MDVDRVAELLQRVVAVQAETAQREKELLELMQANRQIQQRICRLIESSAAGGAGSPGEAIELGADLSAQIGNNERLRAELEQVKSDMAQQNEGLRGQIVQFRERLRGAEELRIETLMALQRFQEALSRVISTYRDQRAWQLMLLMRKLYTQLFRQGWKGRLQCAGFLCSAPFRGIPPLAAYDLTFPAVSEAMPERLLRPLIDRELEPLSAAGGTADVASPDSKPQQGQSWPGREYDVIVLPVFDFDYRFQRPQQLALQFALRGHRVFWVSPSRFATRSSGAPYDLLPLRENIWEVHLSSALPNLYGGSLEPGDVEKARDSLEQLYRDQSISESVVFLQLPFWRRIGLELRRSVGARIVFDCMDEWETFPQIGEFNRSEQRKLVEETDLVIVTGQALHETYSSRGVRPVLVRNGVDFEFFSRPPEGDPLAAIAKPVIGYFGAIADWFDFALLADVAKARPHYSFVLVGGLGLEEVVIGDAVQQLRTLPNIYLLGHKPYREIPKYLRAFDVCTIPFVLNRVTEATDPVKLYEYFSQGKPVVATNMPELAQCDNLVYIGADAKDFASKLDQALRESTPDLPASRVAFAAQNTWRSRYEVIDAGVRQTFAKVSILVVTHNSAEFIRPCLDSLRANTTYPNYEILVADNRSTDSTPSILRAYAAEDIRISLSFPATNTGFAAGNNLLARQAQGQYLVFLNADTMVTPGWLGRLLRHASETPRCGTVVPVTNWAGNEVKINVLYTDAESMEFFALRLACERRGSRFDIEMGPLFCALIPRPVWECVGELDEGFGVGMFEDDDFSFRLHQAGYRVIVAEDCFIHHFGQGSFGKLDAERYRMIFQANRERFEKKWQTPWKPHQYRPGTNPENGRFAVASFVARRRRTAAI